jgi:hypothetical protein
LAPPHGVSSAADADTQLSAAHGQTAAALEQSDELTVAVISVLPAKDAVGGTVPTTLTASGNTVTMHVSPPSSTVYPVIAAPSIVNAASLKLPRVASTRCGLIVQTALLASSAGVGGGRCEGSWYLVAIESA